MPGSLMGVNMHDDHENVSKRLAKALKSLLVPGVKLDKKPGVPYYWAHPVIPGKLIREVDGVETVVEYVDGEFRPVTVKL